LVENFQGLVAQKLVEREVVAKIGVTVGLLAATYSSFAALDSPSGCTFGHVPLLQVRNPPKHLCC
jgi:hypothetical protein